MILIKNAVSDDTAFVVYNIYFAIIKAEERG